MSIALEGREPLLDHRLIEFVANLPVNYKIYNGNKKYLLKQICHKYVPKELMDRNKMGFGIPIVEWFEQEIFDMISFISFGISLFATYYVHIQRLKLGMRIY
jgi:asparagine synthase (glutamine-hydrolysing)